MKTNPIYAFGFIIVFTVLINACASYKAQYLEPELSPHVFPDKAIDKVFYLIGDAGLSPINGMSQSLTAFQDYISDKDTQGDYTLFLGDNIYPAGLPESGHNYRSMAENMINAQVKAVADFDGARIFIPGNHEWYAKGGVAGVRRQEQYVKKMLGEHSFFPQEGCPLKTIQVNENIELIIIDTQWYLEDWNLYPDINENCLIKTRNQFLNELEMAIHNAQGKTIVFAMHHPLYSNGTHGGQFALEKHLFPFQSRLPIPGLASLVVLIRAQGGVSVQDRYNQRYNDLMNHIQNLIAENERVVIVSGHEHNLQYIENGAIKQIVSGSGSKTSAVNLKDHGVFAYGLQGFAVLTIFMDGSSWVQYFGSENNKPHLLFQKEVRAPKPSFDTSILASAFPSTISTAVYPETEQEEAPAVHKLVVAKAYQDAYMQPVNHRVATLDTLDGGLEVLRETTVRQAKSLLLKTREGRVLKMTALQKNTSAYLKSLLLKGNYLTDDFERQAIENQVLNLYTTAHPFAFMAIPDLAGAAQIHHAQPRLFYVPKHKALGDFNREFGDQLYIFEAPTSEDTFSFESRASLQNTYDVLGKIQEDKTYGVDEVAYIRMRLFEMLIGDWNRQQERRLWLQLPQDKGGIRFQPLLGDPGQVFSNLDRPLANLLKTISGTSHALQFYDETLHDVEWINRDGIKFDRMLLQQADKTMWLEQAQFLKDALTDAVIEKAFERIPAEVQNQVATELQSKLKGRRDHLKAIVDRYYEHLNALVVLVGTNQEDHFEITRLDHGRTQVQISRIKNGAVGEPYVNRIFDRKTTKELWIYGLNADDQFTVNGTGKKKIFTRLIGGQGNDVYNFQNGKRLVVYDQRSMKNTLGAKNGARFKLTDVYNLNNHDFEKMRSETLAATPKLGYNPDDGLLLGSLVSYTINGFQNNPFAQQHVLNVQYALDTNALVMDYEAEFGNFYRNWNLSVGGLLTNTSHTVNFFGYGNQTAYKAHDFNYNRVEKRIYGGHIGVVRRSGFGSDYGFRMVFEGVKLFETPNRFISSTWPLAHTVSYGNHYFGALEATYDYLSADKVVNPSKGMVFKLQVGTKANLQYGKAVYGYLNSNIGFYNALTQDKALVLKTDVSAQFRLGHGYLFYQAAALGGNSGLRGYRTERFIGRTALVGSADLRYVLPAFRLNLLPLQITVFGGSDLGRVWQKAEASKKWHNDYGGGLMATVAQRFSGTFNLFTGEDGSRFSFGLGFNF